MKLTQYLILSAFSLLLSVAALAQNKYTSGADAAFNNNEYFRAAELYKKVYSKISKDLDEKARVNYNIGECYRLTTDYAGAAEWYEKAITAQYYKTNPDVYYNYGESLKNLEKYDDAIVQYKKYQEAGGDAALAEGRIADCEKGAMSILEPPSRYVVEAEVMLNSPSFDYSPTLASSKGDEIIFSSTRPSAKGAGSDPGTGESFSDLYFSTRDKKGKWSTPEPLTETVNTESNEGTSCMDDKFKTLYFSRCLYEKKTKMPCDIYVSKRSGSNYMAPELLTVVNREENDTTQIGHPFLTKDEKYMIFASNLAGGMGGNDLWYMEYDKKAKAWGSPVNMGAAVNTSGDEMFPFLKEDGTLYFASNGHPGLGGVDIFMAESTGEMTFANVSNMEYPINSSSDDFGLVYEEGKDQGFLTSNRPGGKGKDDIYSFKLPPVDFCLKATVYSDESGMPLADAKITIQGTDGASYEVSTDGNGGFSLCEKQIKEETNYSVDVAKEGFIGTGDQFSTIGLSESTTFAREYFLKEVVKDKEYKMPLVLYPLDKAELLVNAQVNSKDSLDFLYELLQRNPTFVIQLEAHTDSRGSDSYNMELSQRRAETCVAYLIAKGIDSDRLQPVGRGESMPLIRDDEINSMATEEEKEAAHQVNRRTVFKITAFDYVPKED